jgi:transcriptional regulator with XRE-family HTH domain
MPKRIHGIAAKRKGGAAVCSSTVLGRIVSQAVSEQLLSVRSAAKRVGMSPAQMSRVMRGLYGVRSVHLAKLIVGLNLSAEYVVAAIYAESRRPRNLL